MEQSVVARFFDNTNGGADDATTSCDMIQYGDDAIIIRGTSRSTDFKIVDLSSPIPSALARKLRWLFTLLARTIIGSLQEVIESRLDREGLIPRLWIALSPQKRALLTGNMNVMSDAHIYQLKTLLARLPDKRYLRVVDILENARSYQFDHYLAICVATTDVSEVDNASGTHPEERMGIPSLIENTLSEDEKYKMALRQAREWPELQDRIWGLPAELQLNIKEKLYEVAFNPGKIFPHQYPTANGKFRHSGRSYDSPAPRMFFALNRHNYARYHWELWSGNTFIIGPGDEESTMGFLSSTLPDSAIKAIRSIELRFATRDCGADPRVGPILDGIVEPRKISRNKDMLNIIEEYQMEAQDTKLGLLFMWFEKFSILARHRGLEALSDLTLDFTKAHGLDGVYLGEKFCMRQDLPAFRYGLPANFIIKAPTDEFRDAILARFVAMNP